MRRLRYQWRFNYPACTWKPRIVTAQNRGLFLSQNEKFRRDSIQLICHLHTHSKCRFLQSFTLLSLVSDRTPQGWHVFQNSLCSKRVDEEGYSEILCTIFIGFYKPEFISKWKVNLKNAEEWRGFQLEEWEPF